MPLDGERKLDNPERTHTGMGRTYKLLSERHPANPRMRNLLLLSANTLYVTSGIKCTAPILYKTHSNETSTIPPSSTEPVAEPVA